MIKNHLANINLVQNIYILVKWVEEIKFNDNILQATSLIKYFNNELALQQQEYFKIHNWKSQIKVWKLQVMNRYGLYLNYKLYKYI